MIIIQLFCFQSIVVVGVLNNIYKLGGVILKNLINGGYQGEFWVVNFKEIEVQGVFFFVDVKELFDIDFVIFVIFVVFCLEVVEILVVEKQMWVFIIFLVGFGEEMQEGVLLEECIFEIVNKYGVLLIGLNCIGLMNIWYYSVFM